MTSPPILRSSVMLDISIAQFGQSMAINNASSCSAPKRKSEAVSKLNSSSSRLVVAGFSPRSTRWKQTRALARDYKFEQSIASEGLQENQPVVSGRSERNHRSVGPVLPGTPDRGTKILFWITG